MNYFQLFLSLALMLAYVSAASVRGYGAYGPPDPVPGQTGPGYPHNWYATPGQAPPAQAAPAHAQPGTWEAFIRGYGGY